MHELPITQQIVKIADQHCRENGGTRVIKVNMVIGVLKDKAFADMVTCIAPLVQECRVLPVNSYASRNMNPSVLVEEFHKHGVPAAAAGTIREALSSFTKPDSATVVCGSLYLAGEVRPYLRSLK